MTRDAWRRIIFNDREIFEFVKSTTGEHSEGGVAAELWDFAQVCCQTRSWGFVTCVEKIFGTEQQEEFQLHFLCDFRGVLLLAFVPRNQWENLKMAHKGFTVINKQRGTTYRCCQKSDYHKTFLLWDKHFCVWQWSFCSVFGCLHLRSMDTKLPNTQEVLEIALQWQMFPQWKFLQHL